MAEYDYDALVKECANEPIHKLGGIQRVGALITTDAPRAEVVAVSEGAAELMGLEREVRPRDAVGEALPEALVGAMSRMTRRLREDDALYLREWVQLPAGRFSLGAFRSDGGWGFDIERARADDPIQPALGNAMSLLSMQGPIGRSVDEVASHVAEAMREFTGFDRVCVYRFAPDWSGEVIGEKTREGVEGFLGRHFPAGDVPAQARALYARAPLRHIVDVDAAVAPIATSAPDAPDLSDSELRAVSPVHLQYLRNMGVRASMSVSLMAEDRLWGLVACHHERPLALSPIKRTLARLLGVAAAGALANAERRETNERLTASSALLHELQAEMSHDTTSVDSIRRVLPRLTRALDADGVAVRAHGNTLTHGVVPGERLDAVMDALSREALREVLVTDSIARTHPDLAGSCDEAPGVVAVVFDPRSRDTVAWFREPHDKAKQWAGDHVHKQVTVDPETGRHRLAPRASFALWLEQMRDQSRPWEAHTSTLAALAAGVLMGGFKELLRHEVEMLQRLDALGRLAGGLAHDFNNILTAIISFASLLQEDLPEDDPSAEDTAEILEAAKRGQRLTSDLRAFSAQETSRQPVVDVMTVLEESRGMLDRLTGDAIELVVERGSTHGHVEISRGQLEQILLNLVVNARDALDGAGTIWVRARVETLPECLTPHDALPAGVYVVLTVTDQGAGMNEETLARIFEPFFTTKTDGTGLGLATCWGIVRRAGGRIVPTSEVGRGATFEVYLPRVLPEPARPSAEDDGAPSAVLLVVDDDDQIRRITTRVLQRAGYEVHAAANGDEALLLLEQHQGTIDLVVTDVMMPRMNGPALVKRLRESNRITRALFMSGYPGHALQEQGFDLEEVDLVTKPFTPKALVARVKQALESPGSDG